MQGFRLILLAITMVHDTGNFRIAWWEYIASVYSILVVAMALTRQRQATSKILNPSAVVVVDEGILNDTWLAEAKTGNNEDGNGGIRAGEPPTSLQPPTKHHSSSSYVSQWHQ